MKGDLISRSALLEQECFMDDDTGFRCSVVLSADVRRAPAVDAEKVFEAAGLVKEAFDMAKSSLVPVVRCKDCKHMKMTGHFRWCTAWERIQTMGDGGFCCFGERRADG